MSKITELIKELQLKKKKIDYVEYMKEMLSADQKCVDFIEIQEEVLAKVVPLLDIVAQEIEDGVVQGNKAEVGRTANFIMLSTEDQKILKTLVEKVKSKPVASQNETAYKQDIPQKTDKTGAQKENQVSPQQKMDFALQNRPLANKKVIAQNPGADPIPGTVVGLDAPFVIVKSDAGPTLKVLLGNIKLQP